MERGFSHGHPVEREMVVTVTVSIRGLKVAMKMALCRDSLLQEVTLKLYGHDVSLLRIFRDTLGIFRSVVVRIVRP